MRLMSLTLERYKRFEDKTDIDIAGSVVALVGPNEAGKSSILDAMLAIDDEDYLTDRERTRRVSGATRVELGYVLDHDDRAALSSVPGGSDVRWWTVERRLTNGRTAQYFDLHPTPRRDLQRRHHLAERLQGLAQTERLTARFKAAGGVEVADVYKDALAALVSTNGNLTDAQLADIRLLPDTMFEFSGVRIPSPETEEPSVSAEFRSLLTELSEYEEGIHPESLAGRILMDRRPRILLFTLKERELDTNYNLNQVAGDPPPALANLARLANLDLPMLLQTVTSDDPGERETMLEEANDRLRDVFRESWGQEAMTVRLSVSGTSLDILTSIPGGGYNRFQERSAGLRSFVALRAFLAQAHEAVPSILLVDEAEQHLHYDAQADLIDVFTEQRLVAKVIYTTHSAGCLPRDLGNGIRVVAPLPGRERSTVRKSVWEGQPVGFTPLIFAMGATTFAFLPSRNVLLTEGVTDAMLLPTLFREATNTENLRFQVAPGLSAVRPARMLGLTSEDGSVLFLTDGDGPGKKYRNALEESGVPAQFAFGLDDEIDDDIQLEDLIDPELYSRAVNEILRDFQHAEVEHQASDSPQSGRVDALKLWCKSHELNTPDKIDITQRLLDIKSAAAREGVTMQLLSPSRHIAVRDLCEKITSRFIEPPHNHS